MRDDDSEDLPGAVELAVPAHVAIIMDGNGRWAKQRQMPRAAGHQQGAKTAREAVECCMELGVRYLTLFAFSSENWRRPPEEVSLLLDLFAVKLGEESGRLARNGIRIRVAGNRQKFPPSLRNQIAVSEEQTKKNDQLDLIVAADYGGRWDIVRAARKLAEVVASGALSADRIDERLFADNLALAGIPDPDLLIRTGGERRISNFLLWQLAYTELYFSDLLWPEFDGRELRRAIVSYAERERRFGRTSEQRANGS